MEKFQKEPGNLAKDERRYISKGDYITDELRALITHGELPPGSLLLQRTLAERFGVSSTPVREALRRLESEGLVLSRTHRGAVVADIRFEDIEENYRIRAALESLAASMAASRTDETDLEEIEELSERFAACSSKNRLQIADLNRSFHFRIYECAQLPLLSSLLRLLWASFPQNSPPSMAPRPHEESVGQHRRIVKALKSRNSEEAEKLVRKHILDALRYVLR